MPLRPVANGRTKIVEIRKGEQTLCTYTMRDMVSVADLETTSLLLAEGLTFSQRGLTLMQDIAQGGDKPYSEVERAMKRTKRCIYDAIRLWLVEWSHADLLTAENIERLESEDVKEIVAYIREQMQATKAEDSTNPTVPPAPSGA